MAELKHMQMHCQTRVRPLAPTRSSTSCTTAGPSWPTAHTLFQSTIIAVYMDLAIVKDLGDKIIYEAIPTNRTIPTSTASATSATINALYHNEDAQLMATGKQQVRTGAAVIIAGDTADLETQEFLCELTLAANAAANSLACGSILAGQTSETDEFGDVAFWLGEGPFGKGFENEVLKALGFAPQLPLAKIYPLDLFVQISPEQESAKEAIYLLSRFKDTFAFTVENLVGGTLGNPTVYILVGRLEGDGYAPGWGGLIGMGVAS
ncbi:hypothetical protein OBBRIDRAFT_886717 [Obba rivulosa]|uniref:Uncharacterized protein n=1 Tax=Obba rivulosa TaxID=1052685 RepID=A0A8E2DLQ5_9APHY|nr:hypothetical protein OBBRIDRAFT_886717 [Obba rivulosa]